MWPIMPGVVPVLLPIQLVTTGGLPMAVRRVWMLLPLLLRGLRLLRLLRHRLLGATGLQHPDDFVSDLLVRTIHLLTLLQKMQKLGRQACTLCSGLHFRLLHNVLLMGILWLGLRLFWGPLPTRLITLLLILLPLLQSSKQHLSKTVVMRS